MFNVREQFHSEIARLPMFEGVCPCRLGALSPDLERHYRHGDIIFREGDPARGMYVILHGQVEISRDGVHLVTRQALQIVGEQACVEDAERSGTATAVGAVRLIELPRSVFDELLTDAQFSRNFMTALSAKLRESSHERAYRYAQEQALFGEFRAHVSPEVLNELLAKGPEQYGTARFADAVILFSDIRDFSGRSARMDPEAIATDLGAYLDTVVDIVHAHDGVVDKFIGDAVMAVWGGFHPSGEDVALQAFACAREMEATARKMRFGGQSIAIGIGLNAGQVFMGNVGSDGKRQFTVLGTPVNTAARLEAKAKEFGAPIVVSEDFYARLPAEVQAELRPHPNVELKGVGTMTCYTFGTSEENR